MQRADGRDTVSVMRTLTRRSCSTRAAKMRIMQGGSAGPDGTRRIAHMHAGLRHRTRVGKVDRDDIRRMARSGLVSRARGGPPAVTPVGRWSATAYGLGISFFEMCVLAKVYGIARSMEGTGGGVDGERTATIPLRTVQYFFGEWPIYPGRVQHALSHLRGLGLIPRSRHKSVACDMARLEAIRGELSEVDRWVDDTGEEMHRVLLHGY